ncbi:MAG: tryptophan--tRNA ligase [Mycoplasmoidaceae bacterium]|nr:MAG: tryptophan--tRNA ligase [Mycoplasmoidaceae bacterium]
MSKKQVILTGMTPSAGSLTIGNYIGALKPIVELQNASKDKDFYLFVSNLHALTNPSVDLRQSDRKNFICTYIASGVDLEKTKLFFQSEVPAHAELSWVLTCSTTMGELQRMTQYKDKSVRLNKMGNGTDSIPTGLLVYPPLMAADILLYDSNLVPVGKDQKQHVELTRNIAQRFNNKYKTNVFVLPDCYITEDNPEIKDLQDPSHKMSKSAASAKASIFLNDSAQDVEKKIKVALTDNFNKVKFDVKNQPAISNLIQIYTCLSGISIKDIEKKYSNISNYGVFKKDLTEVINKFLSTFQANYTKATKNWSKIEKILTKNAEDCQKIASKKVDQVYKLIGLRQ